jgi:hypothetical protein
MSNKSLKKRKPSASHGKRPDQVAKTRTWTLPTVLGLVLGVIGAVGVIELRPQMLVSPQEPTQRSQPFSVPFRIENTGYLSFYVEHVSCVVNKVKVGELQISDSVKPFPEWDGIVLDRADGGTVTCNIYSGPITPKTIADIAIVIDYKPCRSFPFGPFTKYFGFDGRYVDNWQWTRKPSRQSQTEAGKATEEYLREHHMSN